MDTFFNTISSDIHDRFDAESSAVAVAAQRLHANLGYNIKLHVEWIQLWGAMSQIFADESAAFVPWVESHVKAWYEGFDERIQDERETDWTNEVLKELERAEGIITLRVQPAASNAKNCSTRWSSQSSTFLFAIPTSNKPVDPNSLAQSLTDMFTEAEPGAASSEDVDLMDAAYGWARPSSLPPLKPIRLPDLHHLPDPHHLLSSLKVHLLVVEYRLSQILIRSTHSESVKLLYAYLHKYANMHPSYEWRKLEVLMQTADFISNDSLLHCDTITIGPANIRKSFDMNPYFIIKVVEAMGYTLQLLSASEGGGFKTWIYHARFA